jgi:hypothetical protein
VTLRVRIAASGGRGIVARRLLLRRG